MEQLKLQLFGLSGVHKSKTPKLQKSKNPQEPLQTMELSKVYYASHASPD